MFFNHEGQHVPPVTFRMFVQMFEEVGWYNLSTADLFADKTVVVFAVPGAFTCPYSTMQLLGYNNSAEVFRSNGVDDILCISVNDPFSLANWAPTAGVDQSEQTAVIQMLQISHLRSRIQIKQRWRSKEKYTMTHH